MTQRLVLSVCCVILAAGALSACSNPRKSLGLEKKPPDEFAVVARAPLSMPPDFKMRPPEPGAPRPQEINPSDMARGALTGGAGSQGSSSASSNGGFGFGGGSSAGSSSGGFGFGGSSGGFGGGGGGFGGGGRSSGTSALLKQAGADQSPQNIRDLVNRETATLAEEEKSVTDRIVFWRDDVPPGPVVNPGEEARRLNNNQALGKPVTTGATPQIERPKRGMLEGIF